MSPLQSKIAPRWSVHPMLGTTNLTLYLILFGSLSEFIYIYFYHYRQMVLKLDPSIHLQIPICLWVDKELTKAVDAADFAVWYVYLCKAAFIYSWTDQKKTSFMLNHVIQESSMHFGKEFLMNVHLCHIPPAYVQVSCVLWKLISFRVICV